MNSTIILKPLLAAALLATGNAAYAQGYGQTNLVTDDQAVTPAQLTDPNLKNPWGIALSPGGGAFWISDNTTGVSTLYGGDVHGSPLTVNSLVVTVPGVPSGTTGSPTGQIFNGGGGFNVPVGGGTKSAVFITTSEDGTLSGWSPSVSATQAQLAVTTSGAVYKGLAIAGSDLYAADFAHNTINVFNSSFASTTLAGNFTDPNEAAGYAPFNIQDLGGNLFVTYAEQDAAKHDNLSGPGTGFVDEFDVNGNFLRRFASGSAVGGAVSALDAPWGLAIAPANFGQYSSDLLVGNFGSGQISVFNPTTGAFLGLISDSHGNPLVNNGLWGLAFGNGVSAGDTNSLYFTAGINDETNGLFGKITADAVPESSTIVSFGIILALSGLVFIAQKRKVYLDLKDRGF